MSRSITICSAQFGDIPLSELLPKLHSIGYEGIEIACQSHLNVDAVVNDPGYRENIKKLFQDNHMFIGAISAHLMGQCVGDRPDPRLDNFAPGHLAGKPEEIRTWAITGMKTAAKAAQLLNVKVVTCFLGSPIWAWWYSFPQTTPEMVETGYQRIKELWTPIFDEYDRCGVRLALEVHPTEIAFDYYSTKKLLEVLDYRPTLGLNFDPSHLLWQGVDPAGFIRDFSDRIYHAHMKDVKINRDGRGGILGSHLEFGDTRRGWNFVSLGHGNVDFDSIIRELNACRYDGPLCVEWEDSGMDRMFGAQESYAFVKKINFHASEFAFDSALKTE